MLQRRQLEFIPALFLILWGAWVANPWWIAFGSSSAFSFMEKFAPEWLWGSIYLLIGIAQMTLLFMPNQLKFRLYTSLTSIFVLSSLTTFIAAGNWRSTAVICYLTITVCEWLAYMEILAEIKENKNGS